LTALRLRPASKLAWRTASALTNFIKMADGSAIDPIWLITVASLFAAIGNFVSPKM
jgi:hypothetical protein